MERRLYGSDLSDARWALIEPVLRQWRSTRTGLGINPLAHDLREIVNAIFYGTRTGIAWEYLPHDFPPAKTVYDYYAKWEKDGTTEQIHDLLRQRLREAATYRKMGARWLIGAGGVRPRRGRDLQGRYLSFAEREEIADLFGVPRSTVSGYLNRPAAATL